MYDDLMRVCLVLFTIILLLIQSTIVVDSQQTIIYVKRGDTVELCDNRSTLIYAYEYRSADGRRNTIVEPSKHDRYSNPYRTSLLRINHAIESDSGQYKCPQDDTEWQKLQVYVPVQHVYLANLQVSSRVHSSDNCGMDGSNCLTMVDGEPLDIVCAADGYPRPALDISLDKNGSTPTIMALATGIKIPSIINNQFKPNAYEAYRIVGLTPDDNGRNLTCHADMKQIDKKLILSTTKQLYIEFRPMVIEKSKKIYCGINHTRTINCTVLRANPNYIRYTINGLSSSIIRRTYGEQSGLQYTFDITPTAINQFRPFNITANNSVGFDTCTYELIHGGIPDPITHCVVDTQSSNITITISCTKSYAQGDNDGYSCTLFKYNDKNQRKMFEEIARTKSCIFALENVHEPVEYRVAAFNRYGSLPVNTFGYTIRLNQPMLPRETAFFNRKIVIIIGSILGGVVLLFFVCCLCGPCARDPTKLANKNNSSFQKDKYPRSSTESEALKPISDDTISHLVPNGGDKRIHQNGTIYDSPAPLTNGKFLHSSSIPSTSVYHQQKSQQQQQQQANMDGSLHYIDRDSIASSQNSIPTTRTRTVTNKFYGHPTIENNKYGPLSPLGMVVPTSNHKNNKHQTENNEIIEGDEDEDEEEEEDESPVYSTTTDVMSESGSFLVPSSSKRRAPPPPKPRYSTLSSVRLPRDNIDKTPLPLPKPRSRSNSRTRLNNVGSDNSSWFYEERPVSSSDSGMGQSDVVCLPNGDTIRSGLVKSRQNSLQKHYASPPFLQQHPPPSTPKYHTLTSPLVRGTEC